ncbi:hypothetical protein [Alkalimonas mucilaginosa]|uniref:Uncharacterized protein n=1 Tax=Alkalimonas mucilaginosa TaxID=3057676 RepID=A0ABU7JAR8_9GAMM|nr:hypothetical protein [Alkalimonas sp. MEB004]MEE2022801.1 hypothetical protein [Alkalimonas sp. MEB004]
MPLYARYLVVFGAICYVIIAPLAAYLGYKLLTDDPINPGIPPLIAELSERQVRQDNFYIQLMSLPESGGDPAKVWRLYQQGQHDLSTERLPRLFELEDIHQHELWCSIAETACQQLLQQHSTELGLLLQSYTDLLSSYQALHSSTELTPLKSGSLSLNWRQLSSLQQLYAISIYQLILQQRHAEAELRLADYIRLTRRQLQQPTDLLQSMQIHVDWYNHVLPLVWALKKVQSEPLTQLVDALQPLSLAEVTNLPAKKAELTNQIQLLSHIDPDILTQSTRNTFYKPKMTLNAMYLRSGIADASQVSSKAMLYQQWLDEQPDQHYVSLGSVEMLKRYYRNYLGGHLVELFASFPDRSLYDRIRLDSKLYILQTLLLIDHSAMQALKPENFPVNPYNGALAEYTTQGWCYRLKQEVCLDLTNAEP